ncbi:Pkinase-domain-containing protein [Dacryopinax primogenitus]|uniref:non-specific serine/threonine protein kinase n=1 Tax=Dacryopinax primogenitus (strain DJM 731) TaxID=1858805 RepID=M5FXG0_DACPD|nr:Pkinase-domain-containing protein [Dacryopinax primogenitus]EJT98171.1 Pkinase-domain-containing protein [Dacryopinax primogenitus]
MASASSYPSSLAPSHPANLRVHDLGDDSPGPGNGDVTPSHGGSVPTGHEYDMPIQPRAYFRDPSPLRHANDAPPPVTNGAASFSRSTRARPLSMPPQPAPETRRYEEETPTRSARPSASANGEGRSKSNARIIGDYTMTKTLGAGSMGKVKLATHNVTGEKLAIKIVPRSPSALPPNAHAGSSSLPPQTAQVAAVINPNDPKSKEASKEIRTIREASLSLLLHHPYICGMRELIVHPHHYYMVFEYVSGGQMLDYIISHGRLRERVARKFARQIGSALEYLHKNSVVHRDLKIENILISQSGNIKLIDFGLSNLYNPHNHLSTFCGSLYFAAPELLNAKVYTGPEVDVWSFGVVLYVLVCGRVPFDDQSMPALHAKIKRGVVEYPNWLSQECKNLLARMLVTNPALRATLTEVLNHPWMNRSYPHPPSSHLLPREPLRADDLDKEVIKRMTGFEFGTEEEIEDRLRAVLEGEAYKRAVEGWERRQHGQLGWKSESSFGETTGASSWSASNSTVATSYMPPPSSAAQAAALASGISSSPTRKASKRFSGFDFYRRKLFPGTGNSPPNTPPSNPPQLSFPPTPISPNAGAQLPLEREPPDPTRGFHPLVSIYYLVREKIERERVYGPGHFASSQLSLVGDEVPPRSSISGPPEVPPKSPMPVSMPSTPITPAQPKSAYNVPTPKLPAPPPSYISTAATSYGVPVAPSPTTPSFGPAAQQPQPRARAQEAVMQLPGEAERGQVDLRKTEVPASPSLNVSMGQKQELAGLGVNASPTTPIKAPAATSHRRSHSLSQRVGAWEREKPSGPMGLPTVGETDRDQFLMPHTAGPEFGTFAEKVGARSVAEASTNQRRPSERSIKDEEITSPGSTLVRRFGSILGTRRERGEHREREDRLRESRSVPSPGLAAVANAEEAEDKENIGHRRAQTLLDRTTGAGKHNRRSSLGGMFGGQVRPRTAAVGKFDDVWEVNEEGTEGRASDERSHEGTIPGGESVQVKPASLKGVFSVSTTSSKSPAAIKADIRRVLDRMHMQYREIPSGFECVHQPSIDLKTVAKEEESTLGVNGARVKRKSSRLSLGRLSIKKTNDTTTQPARAQERPPIRSSASGGSSSFFTLPGIGVTPVCPAPATAGAVLGPERTASPVNDAPTPIGTASPALSPSRGKFLPPIPRDFGGMSPSRRVGPDISGEAVNNAFENSDRSDLVVRFEVNVVKVPLLPLHGIQFRRIGGNAWQYQMLARRVLTELKL